MDPADFKFDPHQKQVLSDVAKRMKLFTMLLVAGSLLSLGVTGFQTIQSGSRGGTVTWVLFTSVIFTALYLVVAAFTFSTATSLREVASSEDQPVRRLVDAMESLKRLFGIQYWLILITILTVIGFVIAVSAWVGLRM